MARPARPACRSGNGSRAGATWRRPVGGWELRAELRAGALRVNGIGFLENDASWLPRCTHRAVPGGRLLHVVERSWTIADAVASWVASGAPGS